MELAVQDYDDISDYLSGFYPGTRQKFLDELEKYTATLEDNPCAFEQYELNPAYRRMVVMDYLVFYKVKREKKTVEIHRILHGARNIRQFLGR
ncbi:type II toxin-antitoxin system RelE/ParE family toxin [Ruminococcaceae bacterium OttesenSCG-928-D13]|nr:type II toxin-antitoxin system RelE/ParE family toxin [Ruminococcaceae bacterium OttesenSCG-928-D13]